MKPHRGQTLDNVVYMLRNWYKWHKRSYLYIFARIPALIAVPMLSAFAPKVMMDSIAEQVSVSSLVLRVALLCLGIAGASWIAPFMEQKLLGSSQILRMRYAVLSFEKTMSADFVDVESLQGRERLERSGTFVNGNYSGAQHFCDVVCSLSQAVFGIITSVALLYKLPAFMLALILVTCLLGFFLDQATYRADKRTREDTNPLLLKFNYFYRTSHEFPAGKDIRLYSLGDWFLKITADVLKSYTKIMHRFLKVTYTTSALQALLYALRDGVAYFFLIRAVQNGTITVSDFIFYFGVVAGFSGYVSQLTYQYNQLLRCTLECQKFRDYLETPEKGAEEKPAFPTAEQYSVEFRDVHFSYRDSETETIKGMDFKVERGENIAIVGENGAGKTTAIKLLCGLYAPTSGEILINGARAEDFSQDSYFDLFSVVFQDYHFLPVSIAKNVTLQNEEDIDRDKLWACLTKAGIREKIESLPDRENTRMDKTVHKDAADFSGGEKQKILLARALYKGAPILILDEPTAALDPIAENELYLQYNALSGGKTSFFISHRLSSTRFCDKILFLSDGKIAEYGTHEELMAKKGKYYQMYQLQSYYYREEGDAI
ncbi:MAG: ABC transporter ATP-binding protein [Candidatus Fimenecus sp.]